MKVRRLAGTRPELLLLAVLLLALALPPFGLPSGIAGLGVVAGSLLGLQALVIALLYARTRILSFAQFGLGAATAALFYAWVLYNQWDVLANSVCHCLAPAGASMSWLQHHPDAFRTYLDQHHPWALGLNAVLSAALGLWLGAWTGKGLHTALSTAFRRSPRIVPTIVTLAFATAYAGAAGLLNLRTLKLFGHYPFSWWPYGPRPGTGINGRPAVPEGTFHAPGSTLWGFVLGGGAHFHLYDVLCVVTVLIAVGFLTWRFRLGRRGLLSRAVGDDVERAASLGIDVTRETRDPWMFAGAVSGAVGVLTVAQSNVAPSVGLDTTALTVVLVAVVLARMTSPILALVTAIALSVLAQAMYWNFHSQVQFQALLVVIVAAALLLQRRRTTRAERDAESVFTSAPEPRPVPAQLRNQPGVRGLLRGSVMVVSLLVLAFPLYTTPRQLGIGIVVVAEAIVGLSLLVLSGWAGQVSLGQLGFAAVGGYLAAVAAVTWHVPLPFAVLLGAFGAAAVAPLVGLPALRLPGPFVVIMSLAFALAVPAVFLDAGLLGNYLPADLPRPILLGIDLSSDRYFYWLSVAVLAGALAVVVGLRRSRLRRALIASRDNPLSAAGFGLDLIRLRMEAFAVAGFLAGLGGALLAYAASSVSPDTFSATGSVGLFLVVVIGGLSAVSGPPLGSAVYVLMSILGSGWVGFLSGVGTITVLARRPGGLASIVVGLRDAAIRVLMHIRGSDLLRMVRGDDGHRIPIADRGPRAPVVPVRYRLVGDGYGPVEGTRLPKVHGVAKASLTLKRESEDLAREVDRAVAALSCHRLDVSYGGVVAVQGVSLSVAPGEILAIVGLNGAGKTSLLRALAGLEPPSHGTVELFGEDVTLLPPHQRAQRGLAFVPGGSGVLPRLTVGENLSVVTRDEPEADVLERFPVLRERLSTPAGNLSGGEQQMLSIAQALLQRPKVLLIDELSLGLSPEALGTVLDIVSTVAQEGTSVVLVEQSITAAIRIAHTALFLESGRVRYQGPAQALQEHPELFASIAFGASGAAIGSGSEVARSRMAQRVKRDAVLQVTGLSAAYGEIPVVDSVTFEVAAGEVVGVIGPNGAGKTSLFDCLSGLLPPTAGAVTLLGQDVTTMPPHRRASLGMMRSFQSVRLFPSLSVRDGIGVALETRLSVKSPIFAGLWLPAARTEERKVGERVDALLELLGIESLAETTIGALSLGSRRLVDLACQLAARPKVLLLDEPAAGLAQAETELLGPLVSRISSDLDCAILIVEHNIAILASVADRLLAMQSGAVIAEGDPADVLSTPAVAAAYFGATASELEPSI